MSDELIEGHALRGQQPEPEKESPKPTKPARGRKGALPDDEPTGPYIILEPPPEAGDVLGRQSEMSTFHKGLQPVIIDGKGSAPARPTDQSASSESTDLSADLPWSVIESTSPDLFSATQTSPQPFSKKPAAEPPPDFLPHFHTPTGTFPPIKDEILSTQESGQSALPAAEPEAPPDFLSHFHTPTGTFPPIKDEVPPTQELGQLEPPAVEPEAPPAGPPPDFLPHFHTPTGVFPPVRDDLSSTQDVEEAAPPAAEPEGLPAGPPPDFLPHFHTPTGIVPPVRDDLPPAQDVEESVSRVAEPEALPDFSPSYRTPAGVFPPVRDDLPSAQEPDESEAPAAEPEVPPGFSPHYRTPAGIFPPVKDDVLPAQETEKHARPSESGPEALPVVPVPVPDLGEPVSVTHFQEGLHPSEEIEDTAPPPVAPVSSEPSEFIPLFHTPTGVLPSIPDEAPILPKSSTDASGEETGDEVVDAEWVVDVDRRLQRARRKLQATAHQASASERRMKSHLLTTLAVIVITVLAVLIPTAIAKIAEMQPDVTEAPTQLPAGVIPGEMQTAGVPLLLTPTATAPPLYSQGRLAYSSNRDGDFEVYVLDMRGGQLTRLTDHPAADRSPKWSPDGRQLVFVSDRSGNDDLYLTSGSRGEPIQLTSDSGSDRNPAWSPDGSRIVFSRETVDGSHLMSMPASCLSEPDTCEGETSALTPGGYDLFPDWSPDGRWIAFAASDFPGLPSVIALISPEGNNYNALPGTGTSDFSPAWSPDGNRIAFVSYAQGDYDLWVMGADGQGLFQLTQSEALDVEPIWSPDGTYIIFASDRSAEGDFELYLIRSDCTSPQTQCEASLIQLTNDSADDLNPDWIR